MSIPEAPYGRVKKIVVFLLLYFCCHIPLRLNFGGIQDLIGLTYESQMLGFPDIPALPGIMCLFFNRPNPLKDDIYKKRIAFSTLFCINKY